MQAHRIEAIVNEDKTLILKNLPFSSGEQVEVIVLSRSRQETAQNPYPLRDTKIYYADPLEPVAQDEWEATR